MSRLLLITLFSGFWLAQAQTKVFHAKEVTPIAEVQVTLTATEDPHIIELRNFPPDSSPVVYLLSGRSEQVGVGTGSNGQLVFSVAGNVAGQFTAVVRSRTATTVQMADLWVDGTLRAEKVQFTTGASFAMGGLSTSEQVTGVRAPLGPTSHVAYLMTKDGLRILRRTPGSSTVMSPPSKQDVLVVYAISASQTPGPLSVYRNDIRR